jgi:hypothetical protein
VTWTDPVVLELCQRHHEADPERLIVRLCQELLTEYPPDAGPTPLRVLGSCRGVRNYHSRPIHPAAGCSGLLVANDGGYEITVRSEEPEERQNFSIAHEIVHTFFRDVSPYSEASKEEEDLCDIGAAELTMPTSRFRAYLAGKELCFATVDGSHTEFAVSFEAATRRAIDMTDESACAFVATMTLSNERTVTRGDATLRVTKFWRSKNWPNTGSYLNCEILNGSLIARAYANQDERAGRGGLGLSSSTGTYDVEARGYGYALLADMEHRQVLTLARGPIK